jgi:hypothetical protein
MHGRTATPAVLMAPWGRPAVGTARLEAPPDWTDSGGAKLTGWHGGTRQ